MVPSLNIFCIDHIPSGLYMTCFYISQEVPTFELFFWHGRNSEFRIDFYYSVLYFEIIHNLMTGWS